MCVDRNLDNQNHTISSKDSKEKNEKKKYFKIYPTNKLRTSEVKFISLLNTATEDLLSTLTLSNPCHVWNENGGRNFIFQLLKLRKP